MTIQLYDLACGDQRIFFSPYCWRTKMALKHKALSFESLPWKFSEKALLEKSGQRRVPVIVDNGTWVHDSSQIATYLDTTYPDRPALMKDDSAKATARFVEAWCVSALFSALRPICVADVFNIIADEDKTYFRESREKMLGTTLEELSKDPTAERQALFQSMNPLEAMLSHSDYFGGTEPNYADYIVFGTLMWPYTVSPGLPYVDGSAVDKWFNRLLDLNDGFARTTAARAHPNT